MVLRVGWGCDSLLFLLVNLLWISFVNLSCDSPSVISLVNLSLANLLQISLVNLSLANLLWTSLVSLSLVNLLWISLVNLSCDSLLWLSLLWISLVVMWLRYERWCGGKPSACVWMGFLSHTVLCVQWYRAWGWQPGCLMKFEVVDSFSVCVVIAVKMWIQMVNCVDLPAGGHQCFCFPN